MEGSLHASWGGRASIQLYAIPRECRTIKL
jgi:hypothetical protein